MAPVEVALLVVAYLIGSVPSGLLLARRHGVDVRRAGSGNIGATNVARTAGARLGLATLVADVAKGAVPVLAAQRLSPDAMVAAGAGLLVFLGHVFPVVLRFSGGKGVATALGVLLVLSPLAVPWILVAFALAFALWRYVSLASTLAAAAAPIAVGCLRYPRPTLALSALMAAVIMVRHRENFRRLWTGAEPRFALPKRQAPLTK